MPVVQPPVTQQGRQPSTVPVPSVVGQNSAGAGSVLRGAGFVVASSKTYNAASSGTVIGQSPAANTQVRPGSTVTIVVSLGPRPPNPPANLPPQPKPNEPPGFSYSMNSCYPNCTSFFFRMTDDFVDPEGDSWKATDFVLLSGPGTAELTFSYQNHDCSKGCFIFYPTDGRNTPMTFKVQCRAYDPYGSKTSGRVLTLSITYYST